MHWERHDKARDKHPLLSRGVFDPSPDLVVISQIATFRASGPTPNDAKTTDLRTVN